MTDSTNDSIIDDRHSPAGDSPAGDSPAGDSPAGDSPAPVSARSAVRAEAAAVVVGSVALAALLWWPLLLPGRLAALDPGDPAFEAWNLDWVRHAITRSPGSLFSANIFHPAVDTLAYSDTRIAPGLFTAALGWTGWAPVTLLGWAMVAGVAANLASGYLLGRVVWGRRRAGVITGLAFGVGPLPVFLMYHVHMTWRFGLPLALAGIWLIAEAAAGSRAPSARRTGAVLLALAALVSTLTSVYQAGFLGLVVLIGLLLRRRDLWWRPGAAVLVASAVGALPGVPVAVAHLRVVDSGEVSRYGLASVSALSAHFGSVDGRAAWASWLGPTSPADRLILPMFPGVVVPVLAVAGAVWAWRIRGPHRDAARLAAVLVVVGGVLAIGAGPDGWRRFTPMALLFQLPLYNAIRGAGRYWVLGLLGMALLAGAAAAATARLPAFRGRAGWAVLGVMSLALMVEGRPDLSDLPRLEVTAVDRSLATNDPPARAGAVAYLPLNLSTSDIDFLSPAQIEAVYRSTAHHRPILNGYSGTFPRSYLRISGALQSLPAPAAIEELRRLGVTDVVVTDRVAGTPWERLTDPAAAAPLELIAREQGGLRYRVPD